MGFELLDIKYEYRIPRDNVITDFYNPALSQSIEYDRSVGYFSSSALVDVSYGICNLVKKGGRIKLIVSPNLSEDDYKAINKGYEDRDKIVNKALLRTLISYEDYYKMERLNLMAELIALDILDIRIAFSMKNGTLGLYHEKMGIMIDEEGNEIAFSGSMNETYNAMNNNYETIDVFTSWHDGERVKNKSQAFKGLWSNHENGAVTYDFPDAVKRELLKYNTHKANYEIDEEEKEKIMLDYEKMRNETPCVPENIQLRDYQIKAINSWRENDYVGIFDMATGTGKTITAIAAIIDLLEHKNMKMGIIICVPYQHLVDQWSEDLEKFHFKPILGYSSSPQKKWKEKLKRDVFDYSFGFKNSFCLVITNASFKTNYVQECIKRCRKDLVLVVDEAHNFGAKSLLKLLTDKYKYRLALSATFERVNDEEGTEELKGYFKKKCIEYTLAEAIDQNMLTPYYYYPVKVYLDPDELEKYNRISYEISKQIKFDEQGRLILTEKVKMLLIARSRVIAGARQKINVLENLMVNYKDKNHLLIYCGATSYNDLYDLNGTIDHSQKNDKNDIRQIQAVQRMLSQKYGMLVSQYTSEETAEQRKMIKDAFVQGEFCQAIVAIKCLDEGVNIPSIDTAFILASSTNPKEYIQRRGRVLRLAEGKDFATIYDFVTLPRDLNNISATDDIDYDLSLIKREMNRVKEFASLSENEYESFQLIDEIESIYGDFDIEEKWEKLLV